MSAMDNHRKRSHRTMKKVHSVAPNLHSVHLIRAGDSGGLFRRLLLRFIKSKFG